LELGIEPADFGEQGGLQYSFVDGFYAAYQPDQEILGDEAEADAVVLSGVVNGKRTLAIDFRGTDQSTDAEDYANFPRHYAKFKPLIDGLKSYLADNKSGIDQILIGGHHIGAAVGPDTPAGVFFSVSAAPAGHPH